jgi:peroxiredoxin
MMNRKAPKVGEKAADFTLATPDGKKSVTLSKCHSSRPLVLIFGSFT